MTLSPQWMLEWGLAGFVALLSYLIISVRDLKRSEARLAIIYSAYKNSAYYWLLYVVIGLLILVSVDLVLMAHAYVQRSFLVGFIQVTNWLVASYFIVIAFFSVYRPDIFFHEDRMEDAADIPAHNNEELTSQGTSTEPSSPAMPWRELDEGVARALARRLDELMDAGLYRQHDLSLAGLATQLGASVHQTSELLNVHLRVPFYEYLNQHRLRYACRLLEDRRCEMRVLDIAFEAGFGNKNSFYRGFRAAYGVTPVEYRKLSIAQTCEARG
jgi:AraC-like DNA-binding protein